MVWNWLMRFIVWTNASTIMGVWLIQLGWSHVWWRLCNILLMMSRPMMSTCIHMYMMSRPIWPHFTCGKEWPWCQMVILWYESDGSVGWHCWLSIAWGAQPRMSQSLAAWIKKKLPIIDGNIFTPSYNISMMDASSDHKTATTLH